MSYNGKVPRIVYGASLDQALDFSYPPVNKPIAVPSEATRSDSVTLTGDVQSLHVRTDQYFDLQMDWVPVADVEAWQAFMDFALTGGTFRYHADSTLPAYTTFMMQDKTYSPQRAAPGFFKFKQRFRVIGTGSANS